jgi:hypothetical protein
LNVRNIPQNNVSATKHCYGMDNVMTTIGG